jgi:hypothetical protein
MTYIVTADCQNRMTSNVLVRLFDDDGDGTADATIVAVFIADAESILEQSIAKAYGDDGLIALRALNTSCPQAVKRLCLDIFELLSKKRHPEYDPADWVEHWKLLKDDLKELRLREVQLDTTGEPEDGVTDGITVADADPDETDDPTVYFLHGMGVF